MSRHLFWLSDEAWAAIEPHLPHGRWSAPWKVVLGEVGF